MVEGGWQQKRLPEDEHDLCLAGRFYDQDGRVGPDRGLVELFFQGCLHQGWWPSLPLRGDGSHCSHPSWLRQTRLI